MESWVGMDKLVVQTRDDSRRSDFYTVDLRHNQLIKIGGGFLWNHHVRYSLTAAGSVIYAIGGMLNWNRYSPACAALGDNIFVFGYFDGSSLSTFGEFYDKKNGSWKAIPMPGIDHQMHIYRPIVSDPKNNRFLVYFDLLSSLYAYYPCENHKWVCLDDHMLSWIGEPASSTVDDVLYFVNCNTDYNNDITAYDILTKDCLEVSWSSCSPFGPDILDHLRITQMLHLGRNVLCFTHISFTSSDTLNFFWEYYRFQVCRVSQQKVLLTPLSVHRLPAPIEGGYSQLNTIAL